MATENGLAWLMAPSTGALQEILAFQKKSLRSQPLRGEVACTNDDGSCTLHTQLASPTVLILVLECMFAEVCLLSMARIFGRICAVLSSSVS